MTDPMSLSARPAADAARSPGGDRFLEPLSGQWIERTAKQPVAQWITGLPHTEVALSTIERWQGASPRDAVAAEVERELRAEISPPAGAVSSGVVAQLGAEFDNVKVGYAMGQLAAQLEGRVAADPQVPHDRTSRLANELRVQGAALSFGAAREATAKPNEFTFGGKCYSSANALAAAVQHAKLNQPGPTLREYTPAMQREAEIAELDRRVNAEPAPLGQTYAQTAYWVGRASGHGPEQLRRDYAGGQFGDALLGVGGAAAATLAARAGTLGLPGPQNRPFAEAQRSAAPTAPAPPRSQPVPSEVARLPFRAIPGTPEEMTRLVGTPSKVGATPDGTRRLVWEPDADTRIRFESHPDGLKPGDPGFNPRHHGEHYHIELKPSGLSWNKAGKQGQIVKVEPGGYSKGDGTGFLPGERLPIR